MSPVWRQLKRTPTASTRSDSRKVLFRSVLHWMRHGRPPGMGVGDAALAHVGGHHRGLEVFRQLDEEIAGLGDDDPPPRSMTGCLADRTRSMAFRIAAGLAALGLKAQRGVRLRVVDDLALLHV